MVVLPVDSIIFCYCVRIASSSVASLGIEPGLLVPHRLAKVLLPCFQAFPKRVVRVQLLKG